jgi:hypothetical protein
LGRGLSLILDGNLLGEEYQIELYIIRENGDRRVLQMFDVRSNLYYWGLGFIVRRLVREDDKAWIYGFEIWQRLKFYAVTHPGDLEELKAQFGSS